MRSAAPVAGAPVAGEEAARHVDVFGGDRQPPAVARPEPCGHVVEVLHGDHVDPRLRHGDDDVAMAEAERQQELGALREVGHRLLDLVAAGDAEVDGPGADLAGDLRRRQERDLDAFRAGKSAAVASLGTRLDDVEPGTSEERGRAGLQSSLGGHGDDEGVGHRLAPIRSSHMAKPTAGTARPLPPISATSRS